MGEPPEASQGPPPTRRKPGGKKSTSPSKCKKAKAAATTVSKKAWGSLSRPLPRSRRSLQVSRGVLAADGAGLGLFTQNDSLSNSASRNLSSQLNAPPKFKEVMLPQRGRVFNEQAMLQIGPFTATQTDFSCLKNCSWLSDNLIDMFLRRYVQETVPPTFCFTPHFMEKMIAVEGASVVYDHEKVQRWSDGIEGDCLG